MRGIDRSQYSVRRRLTAASFGFFVVCYALAMTALASGGTGGGDFIPRGQPIPQGIRWQQATATGANTSAWATWTNAAGQTSNHRFPVAVGSATLGKAFRGVAKRVLPGVGWFMTAKSLLDGAGWAIDELQGQVIDPGVPRDDLGPSAYCLQVQSGERRCASSPGLLAAVAHFANPAAFAQPCSVAGANWLGQMQYQCVRISDGVTVVVNAEVAVTRPGESWPVEYVNANPGSDPTTISDYDVGQLLKQHPEVINAVLIDPETGMPLRTPELVSALNDLRRALEAANGVTTPGTDLTTGEEWQEEPPPNQTDWPEFCAWGKPVCDFIDWFKSDHELPEDIELPYEEREIEWQHRDSGLGGGSCPAPITAAVLDTSVEFGYEGICGFMEYMRPVAIACAWISAAFIVVNARPMRF